MGFLRSADVMVLPSYSENFGIVVALSSRGTSNHYTGDSLGRFRKPQTLGLLSVVNLKQSLEQVMQATADQIKRWVVME
jgi:glycosyltransferase involved in cell wall biosynthesis